jgi:hypothetical protein
MRGKVYIPEDFIPFGNGEEGDVFLCDEYGEIKEEIKNAIYMKPLFSHLFINEKIYCTVWWNDNLGYWCGEIHERFEYVDTYIYESLEDLLEAFYEDYDPD